MALDASDAVTFLRRVKADAAFDVVAVNEHISETSTMERMLRLGLVAQSTLVVQAALFETCLSMNSQPEAARLARASPGIRLQRAPHRPI